MRGGEGGEGGEGGCAKSATLPKFETDLGTKKLFKMDIKACL